MKNTGCKFIICTLALFIAAASAGGWLYLAYSLERNFKGLISGYPGLTIEYAEIQLRPLTRQVILARPNIFYKNDIEIKAREMILKDLSIKRQMPVKMTALIQDMEIIELFSALKKSQTLQQSGTRLSGINGSINYEYCPEEHELSVSKVSLNNPDLGLFCLEMTLSGLNIDYFSSLQNPFLRAAALIGIRINYFRAGYEDYGLLKKLAKNDQLSELFKNQHDLGGMEIFIDDYLNNEQNNPAHKFLYEQKPLIITLTPENPVPISAILTSRSLKDAARLLNLQVTNKHPGFCLQ